MSEPDVIQLFAEEVVVEKETAETGRVRVSKQTRTREVDVNETLYREIAEVERVPIGREVFETPLVRHEGETTIIPVVEEIIERRLILKEEVRITRRQISEPFHERVTLRYQEAVVTRVEPSEPPEPPQ